VYAMSAPGTLTGDCQLIPTLNPVKITNTIVHYSKIKKYKVIIILLIE